VLNLPSEIGIPPGQSFDLLNETVLMRNVFPDVAKLTDKWTVNVFIPEISDDASVKYRIRGRPR
jgi:hypothetical protein